MSATYDDTHSADKDKVRFLLGDTDTPSALLTDAEIEAAIDTEANHWLAATLCGESILMRWTSQSGGLSEKQVDTLRVKFGGSSDDPRGRFVKRLQELRERGAEETISSYVHFRAV